MDENDMENEDYDTIRNETSDHAMSLNNVSKSMDNVELIIVCLGLVANSAGSITLFTSARMSTPSFVYHKALGLANFVYCLNFIFVKTLRQYAWTDDTVHYVSCFPNYLLAYYMGVISRAVSSTCGYFAMYMSLLIIIDRFIALILYTTYHNFNKMSTARRLVLASLMLSAVAHSWAPWVENDVKKMKVEIPWENVETAVYAIVPQQADPILTWAVPVKDVYNLVIRLTYAVAQTVLTICVIRAFHLQNRKRGVLMSSPGPSASRSRTNSRSGNGTNVGWERSLCYLMLAVAVLSCGQVLPREFKRIFDFVYPVDSILPLINDRSLSIDQRRKYMLLAVYGHGYWKLVVNVLTAIERSVLFYLYFILHRHFRIQVFAPFLKLRNWLRRGDGESRPLIGNGPPRRSVSLMIPSARNSTFSKSSIPTTETTSLTTAIWMNRRVSSCVMLLYTDDEKKKEENGVAV